LPEYLAGEDTMKQLVDWAESREYCKRPLEVVPLFVTDNLESSADTLGLQEGVNVGAAVGGTVQNVLAKIGLRARAENKTQARARGFNALQTIGRVSMNTIETRLGAFIARTYNVTRSVRQRARTSMPQQTKSRHAARSPFTSLYRFTDGRARISSA
jgi:hypothetical protein